MTTTSDSITTEALRATAELDAKAQEAEKLKAALEHWEGILDAFAEIRGKVERAFKNNPELMGKDAWLRSAISERDLAHLSAGPDGINAWGSTYTVQTMDHEWFDFTIPWSYILD